TMTTIIVLIVILIVALIAIAFSRQLVMDKQELAATPINKKFEILASTINEGLLDGKGDLTVFDNDPHIMNLMSKQRQNMLIQFHYSTGHLSIFLNYKYYQKELKWECQFRDVRNITIFQQKDFGNQFVETSKKKIKEHQENINYQDVTNMKGMQQNFNSDADPTDVLSAMYKDLTVGQKMSIANLMYMIASAGGNSEEKILKTTAFSHPFLLMNINWHECKKQYEQYGKNKIFNDLSIVSRSVLDMVVFDCSGLMIQLNIPPNINPAMEATFFESFEKLGYSESMIKNVIEKAMMLSQMMGI
ncbi:MAG: hypothetical protein K6F33_05745, partial [Bacteroidales bacterium]|nr:hypothetical protein [Bacteroidales bacterium]